MKLENLRVMVQTLNKKQWLILDISTGKEQISLCLEVTLSFPKGPVLELKGAKFYFTLFYPLHGPRFRSLGGYLCLYFFS